MIALLKEADSLKIKIWLFVLIIVGSLLLGGLGGFVATGGFMYADRAFKDMQQLHANAQLPCNNFGNGDRNENRGNRNQPYDNLPGGGQYSLIPQLPAGLPQGFNAGVSIAAAYGSLTNRTEAQVSAAAQQAGTDVWGLAQNEGKLDQLKAKVLEAVTASLKQMVTSGKITQAQSDSYLAWVNQYLQVIGQTANYGMMPGYGRHFQRNGQGAPSASSAPESTAAPIATPGSVT
jgi:hypothetical protein